MKNIITRIYLREKRPKNNLIQVFARLFCLDTLSSRTQKPENVRVSDNTGFSVYSRGLYNTVRRNLSNIINCLKYFNTHTHTHKCM